MGNKLVKKTNSGSSSSIMDLARSLRADDKDLNIEDNSSKISQPLPANNNASVKENIVADYNMSLEDIIAIVKDKNYNYSEPLKIDSDVKEIFRLMKVNAKIPIAGLISYILEEWIKEHEAEIKQIIQKKNRFL